MTVSLTINGITVTAEKQTDLFEEMARHQEVFGVDTCGYCNEHRLKYVVREDDEQNKYYELRCQNSSCRAKLAFGQNKKGDTLFPRRKDKDNNWLPHGGWVKWNPETKKEE